MPDELTLQMDSEDRSLVWTVVDGVKAPMRLEEAQDFLWRLWAIKKLAAQFPKATPADLAALLMAMHGLPENIPGSDYPLSAEES